MAMRDVQVRLSARVDAYVAAMARAKSATGALSTESVRNMSTVGSSMQRMGRSASLYVTAPLVGAGLAAVSMGNDFERSFSVMEGLANVPAGEVEKLKDAVLSLAGETAVAPQELADALYFAASAGLDSAQSMEVLELAARASAAGMGDVTSVVGLVAGAMLSYGPDVLDAATATDILTAAIREGRADPQELAGALGRVTPIAAAMGVSFGETAGAAAYMTNIMGNTDETITALRGVLLAMLDPTKQAKDALLSIGTSADELQNVLSTQGLVAAFQLLKDKGLNPNSEAMSNLFEDNRALNGAMILLNDESGDLRSTIDAVTNSSGALGVAFGAVADDKGFKMRQAIVDVQVAMTELGEVLLPIAADIMSSVSDMVDWFKDLPGPVQEFIGVLALLAAAGGPLLILSGSLIKNFGALTGVFGKSASAVSAATRTLGLVGIAAFAGYEAFKFFTRSQELASPHIDTASGALERETVAAYNAAVAAGQATGAVDTLAVAHQALSAAITASADAELSSALGTLNITLEDTLSVMTELGSGDWTRISTQMDSLTASYFGISEASAHYMNELRGQGVAHKFIAELLHTDVAAVDAWDEAMSASTRFATQNKDEINELALAYLNEQARIPGATSEALAHAEALKGNRNEALNAVAVYEEFLRQVALLPPAQQEAIMSTEGFAGSIEELIPGLDAGGGALGDFAYDTEQVAMRQAEAIDTMSDYMDAVQEVADITDIYSQAFEDALGTGGQWIRAHDGYSSTLLGFNEQIEDAAAGLEWTTEAGLANRDAIYEAADALGELTQSNIEAGMSQEEVTAEYKSGREALIAAAVAAGLNEDAVNDLLTAYGYTPELITTTMQLAGDALSKWRIDRYLEKLDEIPEEKAVAIEAAIDDGDWAEAERLIRLYTADQTVNIYANPIGFQGGGPFGSLLNHDVGAYVDKPEVAGLAQDGRPEVVLPLTNQGRMMSLLSMPQVYPYVEQAMAHLRPASDFGGGMTPAPSQGEAAPIHVHIYNHGRRELSSRDVESALIRAGVGGRRN